MGIFSRLGTLIKSNLNDLISKAEDPEKMLNQVLVDMKNQLVEAKKQVAVAIGDEKRLKKQWDEQIAQAKEWERKAMMAVAARIASSSRSATTPRKLPSLTTATTPGIAAALASLHETSAAPWRGGRTTRPNSMPGHARSWMNPACAAALRGISRRGTFVPTMRYASATSAPRRPSPRARACASSARAQ